MFDAGVKGNSFAMDDSENIFTSGFAEVDRHVSFLTAFDDEDMGTEHSFLEPACSRDLAGGHLGFGTFDIPKCFSIDNISCAFDDDAMTIDNGSMDPTLVSGEQTKTELFDEVVHTIDRKKHQEKRSLQCVPGRHCNDSESIDETLNIMYPPFTESRLKGSLALQNESTVMSERDCSSAAPDESTGQNSLPLDRMTVRELQDAFRNVFGRETIVRDKQWLKRRILFGIHNNVELDRPLNFGGCGNVSDENENKNMFASGAESSEYAINSPTWMLDGNGKMDEGANASGSDSLLNYSSCASESDISFRGKEGNEMGALVTGKRAHKPTRRYIEEYLELKSRCHPRRSAISVKSSKSKSPDNKFQKQNDEKGLETARSVRQVGSFDGACIQVPFGLPVEEGQLKENALCLRNESDAYQKDPLAISNERSDSECPLAKSQSISKTDQAVKINMHKGKRRRKHHMPWTLSEVMKLIEGVSRLGIGRWSKIKRLLFSSSKHRTSVDLKDKWRNLVKASCTQLRKKRKGLQVRKQLSHQAPESVLRRVKELASSYA